MQDAGKLGLGLLLAGALLGLSSCKRPGAGEDKDAAAHATVPVEVVPVQRAPIIASFSGTAALEPDREAQVVAKTSGVLLKLLAEEGDQVRAGQVLARIDPEHARLELAQAEASMRRLENDYRRAKELFESKLNSQEAFEKIRYDLETQKAAYELAQLELSYTNILAPIDGVISQRLVKEGNLIQLHQALFRIDDFDPLLAVLNVPERGLATLHADLPVTMNVDALIGQSFDGKVARVSPVVDPKTGTFRVTCEFRDPKGVLKSGMFGRVDIIFDRHPNALVVPRSAVIDEDGATSVFIAAIKPPSKDDAGDAKNGKAKPVEKDAKVDPDAKPKGPELQAVRKTVKLGYTSGDVTELLDGLAEGDRVITVGRAAVRDGTLIEVINSPDKKDAPTPNAADAKAGSAP